MTSAHPANATAGIGVEAIDRLGVTRIAEAFSIDPQAVRKWRRQGEGPDRRRDELRQLPDQLPEQVSAFPKVAEVSTTDQVVSPPPGNSCVRRICSRIEVAVVLSPELPTFDPPNHIADALSFLPLRGQPSCRSISNIHHVTYVVDSRA